MLQYLTFLALAVIVVVHGQNNDKTTGTIADEPVVVNAQIKDKNGNPSYLAGRLGKIEGPITKKTKDDPSFQTATKNALNKILSTHFGYTNSGNQDHYLLSDPYWIDSTAGSSVHVRYATEIDGLSVEGSQMILHIHPINGTVYAFNGEYIPNAETLDTNPTITGEDAFMNLQSSYFYKDTNITITSTPVLTIVRNMWTGAACLAYKAHASYIVKGKNRHDLVFVEAHKKREGLTNVCAIHPQIAGSNRSRQLTTAATTLKQKQSFNDHQTQRNNNDLLGLSNMTLFEVARTRRSQRRLSPGVPNVETWNCNNAEDCCAISCGSLVSTSSEPINTGDGAIDSAHNYAIATYNFYYNNFGRDSIDGNGLTLISRVHYSSQYNNAFWDGIQMTYGDGDGVDFRPFSLDADVVGHELTHGVTERTSNLIYFSEPGALNEAMSDIMGSMVDRQEGATGNAIWSIGEDIVIGGVLRNMRFPRRNAFDPQPDFYPERYRSFDDYGGVHINSGIANLAFYLLVAGGKHPRNKTDIVVPGIGFDNATKIFYEANVGCLTPSSGFIDAVLCTNSTGSGATFSNAVNAAWAAVGVPTNELEPFYKVEGISIGVKGAIRRYSFSTDGILPGGFVQCIVEGRNGDADLRMGSTSQSSGSNVPFTCTSENSDSYEQCLVGPLSQSASLVVAEISAFSPFSGITLSCFVEERDREFIQPTISPMPSSGPTNTPTRMPVTKSPTVAPSSSPMKAQTRSPTKVATWSPSNARTNKPSIAPSPKPSQQPTNKPTKMPTSRPTPSPSSSPTVKPTPNPTLAPTKLKPVETNTFLTCSRQFDCGSSLLGGSEVHLDFLGLFCIDFCTPFLQVFIAIGWNCGPCK